MSREKEKKHEEMWVFKEFAKHSGLSIDSDSIENRDSPEPDILCKVDGDGFVAFELKRLVDEDAAQTTGDMSKGKHGEVVVLRLGGPTNEFFKRTRAKEYTTEHPTELVFYQDWRDGTLSEKLISRIRLFFNNDCHDFRRVWYMSKLDKICKCILDRTDTPL